MPWAGPCSHRTHVQVPRQKMSPQRVSNQAKRVLSEGRTWGGVMWQRGSACVTPPGWSQGPLPRGPSVVSEGAKLMTVRVKLHSDRGDRSAKAPRREEAWHVSGIGKKGKPAWVGCSESGWELEMREARRWAGTRLWGWGGGGGGLGGVAGAVKAFEGL